MLRFKFLLTWISTIFISISLVLTLIFSISLISNPNNLVIIGTSWNRAGAQYKSLQNIVNSFNQKNKSNYKLVLKQIDSNKISSIVGAGKLGIRKLPNLMISYGDAILKYDKLLQDNQTGVIVEDLNPYVFQDDDHQIVPEFLRETTHQNKLIVAPIGKSIDYMFVNKNLVAWVFKTLNLNVIEIPSWKQKDWPLINHQNLVLEKVPSYKYLKTLKTEQDIFKMFNRWSSVLDFFKAAKYLLNLSQNKAIYLLGIDDPSSIGYVHYANQNALSNENIKKDFIYSESETQDFIPTINVSGKSQQILDNFLNTILELKRLAPRSFFNPERFNGLRVKMTSNDYNSSFFANNLMFVTIGSSAGMNHLIRKKLQKDDIWLLPVPGQESGKFIMQQGPGIGMFKLQDENKNQVAREFVKYLTSSQINQKYSVEANYLPIHQSSYLPNSLYFENVNKLPLSNQSFIYEITKTITGGFANYQSVPISYEGNNFRYLIFDSSIKNFILDVNQFGIFSNDKEVSVSDFWTILKDKVKNQFSNRFIFK